MNLSVYQGEILVMNEIIAAIIGVIGALLGTFTGWFLNSLNHVRKCVVYVNDFSEDFFKEISDNRFCYKYYKLNLDIDICNNNLLTIMLRDIKITFMKKNKLVKQITPKNASNNLKIKPINVMANSVIQYELYYKTNSSNEIQKMLNCDKIFFCFRTHKNKKHEILLYQRIKNKDELNETRQNTLEMLKKARSLFNDN